jgi:hypothetical protein
MKTGYRTQSPDTSREAEERQFDHWRGLAPVEKARIVAGLTRMTNQLARAGIRARYPEADEREIELRMMALRVGRGAMLKYFGWDPDHEGPRLVR